MQLINRIDAVVVATALVVALSSCSSSPDPKEYDPHVNQDAERTPDWLRVESKGRVETVVISPSIGFVSSGLLSVYP